jgi:hypothetical protein
LGDLLGLVNRRIYRQCQGSCAYSSMMLFYLVPIFVEEIIIPQYVIIIFNIYNKSYKRRLNFNFVLKYIHNYVLYEQQLLKNRSKVKFLVISPIEIYKAAGGSRY